MPHFEVEVEDGLVCLCDGQKLRQILWNLIQNSVQAVGEEGRVWIIARAMDNGRVRFEIRDNGEGMESDVSSRIFDPFFTTRDGGTGLGLALVYEMIQAHEGDVGVESQLGQGTTVWFELPNREKNEQTSAA